VLYLAITKNSDWMLRERMANHYSHPAGFVGRNICYAVIYGGVYYGHTVAGSATRFLPGRNEYLGIALSSLNSVANNVFFNINHNGKGYPCRNFGQLVVTEFAKRIKDDWMKKYGDELIGLETLVEKPRTGEVYKRAGWVAVGETTGYTCKRIAGNGTDSWSGKRVWNTEKDTLRPKLVFCYKV